MADYGVEVFREETDALTEKVLALVRTETGNMPAADRGIIVAAALANVACFLDATEPGEYRPHCSGALKRMAVNWRG